MDLALTHGVVESLGDRGKEIDAWQQRGLVRACQEAKERLLSGKGSPARVPVTVLGRGSRLIGGTLKAELTREQTTTLLIDGFFPVVDKNATPAKARRVGLTELGLPYASDPAITRHLAAFLGRHARRPTCVLWNGGVMKAQAVRDRLLEVLTSWLGQAPRELGGTDLDLAVAHGAASYGPVERGLGGTISRSRGGTARTY
jgi:hypothetical protein